MSNAATCKCTLQNWRLCNVGSKRAQRKCSGVAPVYVFAPLTLDPDQSHGDKISSFHEKCLPSVTCYHRQFIMLKMCNCGFGLCIFSSSHHVVCFLGPFIGLPSLYMTSVILLASVSEPKGHCGISSNALLQSSPSVNPHVLLTCLWYPKISSASHHPPSMPNSWFGRLFVLQLEKLLLIMEYCPP